MKSPTTHRFDPKSRAKRRLGLGGVLLLALMSSTTSCSQCSHSKSNGTSQSSLSAPGAPPGLARMNQILTHNSNECAECARTYCQPKVDRCLSIEGNAAAGPSKGKARSELCLDTLGCAIKARCVNDQTSMRCYCGSINGPDCLGPKANGSCKAALESGFETTAPQPIAVNWIKDTTGGGAAMNFVQCLLNNSCTKCF
jgi:hypothetical protein